MSYTTITILECGELIDVLHEAKHGAEAAMDFVAMGWEDEPAKLLQTVVLFSDENGWPVATIRYVEGLEQVVVDGEMTTPPVLHLTWLGGDGGAETDRFRFTWRDGDKVYGFAPIEETPAA